jgi:hypothetical protein
LEEIIKNLITDTVTDAVTNAGIEAIPDPSNQEAIDFILSAPADASVEDLAWGVTDVLLDTGAAEGIAAFFGAPIAIVIGIKMFKRWRKEIKAKQMMGKNA